VKHSLLPFGDMFAVLMVVFMVMSMSVGTVTRDPQDISDRGPLVITIGNFDTANHTRDGLLEYRSSEKTEEVSSHSSGFPLPDRALLDRVAEHGSLIKEARSRPYERFVGDKIVFDPNVFVQPIVPRFGRLVFDKNGLPRLEPNPIVPIQPTDTDRTPPTITTRTGGVLWGNPTKTSPTRDIKLARGMTYDLLNDCKPLEYPENSLVVTKKLVTERFRGFENEKPNSVSILLPDSRNYEFDAQVIFEASPSDYDPSAAVAAGGLMLGYCRNIQCTAYSASFLEPSDIISDSFTSDELKRLSQKELNEALKKSNRRAYLEPKTNLDKKRLAKMAAFRAISPSTIVTVYGVDGSVEKYRTPTWWELSRPNHGRTNAVLIEGELNCRQARSRYDRNERHEFQTYDFKFSVNRRGQFRHFNTLIKIDTIDQ